jgi:hypothetical protein
MTNKIKIDNTNDFTFLLINTNNLSELNWNDPHYLDKILKLDIFNEITTNCDNFIGDIKKSFNTDLIDEKVLIDTQIISETPEYIYEIMYFKNKLEKNDLGSLLIRNGESITGSIIVFKTHILKNSENIFLVNINKHDIQHILDNRVKTKIVIYDNKWEEITIIGNIETYATNFFDDTYFKIEIPFLKHNINIWYEKLEGCSTNICGKLLDRPIYKCLWFTMLSDEHRGSIYLEEVNNIIKLSYKLEFPYDIKKEWEYDEEKNKKYNKYQILEKACIELL